MSYFVNANIRKKKEKWAKTTREVCPDIQKYTRKSLLVLKGLKPKTKKIGLAILSSQSGREQRLKSLYTKHSFKQHIEILFETGLFEKLTIKKSYHVNVEFAEGALVDSFEPKKTPYIKINWSKYVTLTPKAANALLGFAVYSNFETGDFLVGIKKMRTIMNKEGSGRAEREKFNLKCRQAFRELERKGVVEFFKIPKIEKYVVCAQTNVFSQFRGSKKRKFNYRLKLRHEESKLRYDILVGYGISPRSAFNLAMVSLDMDKVAALNQKVQQMSLENPTDYLYKALLNISDQAKDFDLEKHKRLKFQASPKNTRRDLVTAELKSKVKASYDI